MPFCVLHTTETQPNSGAYFSPLQEKMKLKNESEKSLISAEAQQTVQGPPGQGKAVPRKYCNAMCFCSLYFIQGIPLISLSSYFCDSEAVNLSHYFSANKHSLE